MYFRVRMALGILLSVAGLSSPAYCSGRSAVKIKEVKQDLLAKQNNGACVLDNDHLKFFCESKWETTFADERTTLITISKYPYVTLTISKPEDHIVFLEQISYDFLLRQNIYAENFQRARVPFAGTEAIMVKAFSKIEPEMRYLSYFFINDEVLYHLLFSVYPKKKWNNYKFLIKKIADSFEMLIHERG